MSDDRKDCPSLEEIAAFAEGRLTGPDRERVIGHLADCPDCREVAAATMQGLEELAVPVGGAEVMSLSRGPARPRVVAARIAAAALVALALGALGYWQLGPRSSPPARAGWIAALPPADEVVPSLWGGVVMRGGEATRELTRQSAEVGALLVDVDVASRAGDAGRAGELLRRMAAVLDAAGQMEPDVAALRRIAEEGDAAKQRAELGRVMPGLESRLRERFTEVELDLGTFAEEVRLAGLGGRGDLLGGRDAQRYVRWVLGHAGPLDDDVRTALERLQDGTAAPAAQAEAASRLLDALTF
jgi:hypothetical protein